jgi:hypothetical protein
VFWATAQNTSLIYVNDNNRLIMKGKCTQPKLAANNRKVDNTSSVIYNEKRYAPELISRASYDVGTVFVMDAVHLPYGCSVWPSFWTQGDDWPSNGEIDIMEGVNMVTTNQMALHTEGDGCYASTASDVAFTGVVENANCSTEYNSNQGCAVTLNDTKSYGADFAAAGGGVYVAEYAGTGIKIWFLSRADVPSSLSASASSINTDDLGTPAAYYPSSTCDIDKYFGAQRMTLDITLCGSWAGTASVLEETCEALQGDATCYTTYVINDQQSTYANAYFEINYINVYSSSSSSSASSSSSSTTSAATVRKDLLGYGAVAGIVAVTAALVI